MAASTSTVTISRHSGNSGMTSSWRNRAISDYLRFTWPKVLHGRNWLRATDAPVCRRVAGIFPHCHVRVLILHCPSTRENTSGRNAPMIQKIRGGQYRLYSRKKDPRTGKRRNLGTFRTRAAAERHERAVQFFKRG